MCLLAKRLEDGQFRWPNIQDGVIRLSAAQLTKIVKGHPNSHLDELLPWLYPAVTALRNVA
jgi:transposase